MRIAASGLVASVLAACGPARAPVQRASQIDSATVAEIATLVNSGFAAWDSVSVISPRFERAYALNPEDDAGAFFVSVVAARAKDTARLGAWLDTLSARGSCLAPRPVTLGSLGASPAIAERLETIASHNRDHPSQVAFRIETRDLMPESIAYDSATGTFYIGSLVRRQIFRARRRGDRAELEPFTRPGQDSLFAVIGIKVDPIRRLLWAASGAENLMGAPRPEETGQAMVVAFDLATGRLEHRYPFAPPPSHLTNDLAIDSSGRVYVTDQDAGAIYRIDPGANRVDTLFPASSFANPNGIAVTPDGRTLFVADWSDGVWRIDVAARSKYRLPQVAGPRPVAIDGLYLRGHELIGISWALSRGRVTRFTLTDRLDRITAIEHLECNHPAFDSPTTGVIVGDSLFYIANSQFTRYSGPGQPLPVDSLQAIVILKRKL